MGKKKYNWKARRVNETKVDDSETKKIVVEFADKEYGEDGSNVLVLPSTKRQTTVKKTTDKNIRILSKQQRKKLEKIVEKKKKKENRASLLEALAKVQIPAEELDRMVSISKIQSKGLKKNLHTDDITEYNLDAEPQKEPANEVKKLKSISGAKRRKYLLSLEPENKKKKMKKDLNVVGLDSPSSSESDDNSEGENQTDINVNENPITEELKQNNDLERKEINGHSTEDVVKESIIISDDESESKSKTVDSSNVQQSNNLENNKTHKKERKQNKTNKQKNDTKNNDSSVLKLLKSETIFIEVNRDPEIQVARLALPILAEEQSVMECINSNAIVLIAGETGSGKTTQVPQFLYEAGYARDKMIGITEPRRVAAVSMSVRVAKEMNLTSREVSYLMRYEGNVTEDTKIKFMTDGVLLKEIETDFLLTKYSVIIIDEAHERSIFTDILIGLLSRIVPLRCKKGNPLRLIIMSATLRIEDFTENTRLFKIPPPVLKIENRQFPVTIHFNKRTEDDYVKAAFSKAIKIHTKLPEGGILIFVTGQQEVNFLVKRLRHAFPYKMNKNKDKSKGNKNSKTKEENEAKSETEQTLAEKAIDDSESENSSVHNSDDDLKMMFSLKKVKKVVKERQKEKIPSLPKFDLNDFDMPDEEIQDSMFDNEDDDITMSGDEDEWDALTSIGVSGESASPLWVLPLYSMLPPTEQAKVFQPPPENCRLCVVATNVAETSLTIPNIKYVVDTGKQKIRLYEKLTGASAMRVVWISQASGEQRAGRAGRCAPGHCYRLYSSAVYQHDFLKDREPEIRIRPVDDLLLQMKCMGIDKVVNFPFPSAPDIIQLKSAELRLEILGALEKAFTVKKTSSFKLDANEAVNFKVTPLGRAISGYPVLPRYGKMLALSHQHNLFQYTVCMVAALSVQEVLIGQKRKWLAFGENLLLGDPGMLLNIVGAAEHAALSGEDMEMWCNSQGIRHRALQEIRQLRGLISGERGIPPAPKKPPGLLARPLRQILLAGLGDCVAKKVSLEDFKTPQEKIKHKYAYNIIDMEEPVFIHSGSVLRKELPEWVVYQEIYEAGEGENVKMIMRGVTAIEPEWLPVYAPKLCNLGEPLADPCPRYDEVKDKMLCHVNATFSRSGWQLPICEIDFPQIPDIHRWFAVYLLNGSVVKKLQKYTPSLLSPPTTMIKSWAKLQPRTESMYRSLMLKKIHNKASLINEWKTVPHYLLDAYLKWIPESAHDEVTASWPPVE